MLTGAKGGAVRVASSGSGSHGRLRLSAVLAVATVVSVAAVPVSGVNAAASASSPTWSVVPSPNPPAPAGGTSGAGLNGIACPAGGSCVVVGDYVDGYPLPLVGYSTGSTWSIAAADRPTSYKNPSGQLSTVACATRTRCFGVGTYYNGASTRMLIEQWNGKVWSLVPNPKMPGITKSSLSGIACPTGTSCFAVGYVVRAPAAPRTLVEHWNGTTWSVVPSANPSGGGRLSGISCLTNAHCVAVGASSAASSTTLVERWNGTTWSVVASPNPPKSASSVLGAVSCPTKNACFAVGSYFGKGLESPSTLVEQSNGDTWSIVATPDKPRVGGGVGSALGGITCLSPTACFAVGIYQSNYTSGPRVMRWDGKSWSRVNVRDPNTFANEGLSGISCASTIACVVVGFDNYGTVVEKWNGTSWAKVAAGGSASHLDAVACPTATTCFAVGASAPGFRYWSDHATLVEQWNGAGWKIVPTPDPTHSSPDYARLLGISCPSATSCFAVGGFGPGGISHLLVEHWDGTRWSLVTVADPPGFTDAELTAVSCGSPTSCLAVGYSPSTAATPSFLERWDGGTWTTEFVTTPAGGTAVGPLGVACASASACVAVGAYRSGTAGVTLIEDWDGTNWTVDASPNSPTANTQWLASVACPAPDHCYAVGSSFNTDDSTSAALIEQSDGTAWSIVPSPNPANVYAAGLTQVACLATTSCFAVGSAFRNASGDNIAVLERWDGTSWSLVPVAVPSDSHRNQLTGITCGNANCTAVGFYETGTSRVTFIERYS